MSMDESAFRGSSEEIAALRTTLDPREITVTLSSGDLVFLDAYTQRQGGEQADVEISNRTRSAEARQADRSAAIHDALRLLFQVGIWEQERGDYDGWYAQRIARMQAEEWAREQRPMGDPNR